MKKITVLLLCLMCISALSAQDAINIMQASRNKTKIEGLESISTLIIRDTKDNERTRKTAMISKSYPDEIEKRLIRFIEPADVKGMSMLIVDNEYEDDDIWIYMPANHQSRRIVSSEKSKSFMGSEFSNADMSAPNLNDFEYQLLGEEMIDHTLCWKIGIHPKTQSKEDEYGFLKKISWFNKTDNIIMRSDYYDFDNELHKTLTVLAYREIDPTNRKYIITHMKMNNLQNGRNSEMIMDQVVYNPDVPDKYFTLAYMKKP